MHTENFLFFDNYLNMLKTFVYSFSVLAFFFRKFFFLLSLSKELATYNNLNDFLKVFESQKDLIEKINFCSLFLHCNQFFFQVFIWLTAILVTLVLVVLKKEAVLHDISFWLVVSPMFIADALNTYFCVIIFIRMYLEGMLRQAALRALWSFSVLALGFIFKFLLCTKLIDDSQFEYSAVMSPVFILLQLIIIRACHLNQ